MKDAILVLVMLTLLGGWAAPAFAQDKLWAMQFGTSAGEYAKALTPDGAGGVMVAGVTTGSLGGPTVGHFDAFVARYDAKGIQLWIRQFGTIGADGVTALAPDGTGGVMVAGSTQGSLSGSSSGEYDAFVARYDANGNQLWIRQFGTNLFDFAYALASDGAGGVMIAGTTVGNLGGSPAGGADAFVARYDANGNQLWVRQFGTSLSDVAHALAPDGAGGVMVAGTNTGSHASSADAFVARYDANGNQLWTRQFGTPDEDRAYALAPDGAGGVMVAGTTKGNLSGANAGDYDAFVARYDADGTQLWIRQLGTAHEDRAHALAADGAGGVMVAGSTFGSLGGPTAGHFDAFVAGYDADGNQSWLRQFGTDFFDSPWALTPDGAGGVIIAGQTSGSLGGTNAGSYDVLIARYVPCAADLDTSTGAGVLDILDFLAFQNAFILGERAACDCDTSTGWLVCDVFDFLCFQDAFVAGCP